MNNRRLLQDRLLYIFAFTASILLSFWLAYRETVINPDGICYLMSAQMVGSAALNEVMHLCPQSQWPFYSVLIYGLAHITHLSYAVSAYLLDSLFSLFSVVTFILIVKELGGSRRVLWLAAFTILLSHEFNSIREYIIRDHGFWAFYLVSMYFLLRYFRQPKLITASVFSVSLVVATLFRIEGALFLLGLPFLSWFDFRYPLKQRAIHFFSLNLLTIFISIVIGTWLISHPAHSSLQLGRVAEIIHQLQHGLTLMLDRYQTMQAALAQYVLTTDSQHDAGVVLLLVMVAWYVVHILDALSWIYGALVIYAWWRKITSFTSYATLVVGGYLAINVMVTFCFLAERSFLSKRYVIALALVLMLWVPFALNELIEKKSKLRERILLGIAAFFIFISSMGGIIDFGYSKSYIHTAGNWIADNVPADATLYANDYQLMYYSQHFGYRLFENFAVYSQINAIAKGRWRQYDYLALRLGEKEEGDDMAALMREITLSPVHVFSNKRGDRVAIYKIRR